MAQTLLNSPAQVDCVIRVPAARRRWDAPAPLRFWHLTSLDAPTVAVVWTLAFAWAAKVSLPLWIPLLLALATWSVYIADRLLDARAALRSGNLHGVQSLRQRHWFHHRHQRLLGPVAIAAACSAFCIVVIAMPVAARERNSVLGVAALVYFTRVHTSRRLAVTGFSRLAPPFKKEFFVGLIFTAACALPALSRALAQTNAPIWPLLAAAVFFAVLAWLNCHAIERWETEAFQRAGEAGFSGAEQAAEKGLCRSEHPEGQTSGAEAHANIAAFTARLKSCPDTKLSRILSEMSFSAASEAQADFAALAARLKSCPDTMPLRLQDRVGFSGAKALGVSARFARGLKPPPPSVPSTAARFVRGLKPPPPSGSSSTASCALAVTGLMLACALFNTHPRSAALVMAGAVSAGLLAFLDRFRNHLTPLALRVSADLVLLAPIALLTPWTLLVR